MRKAATKRNGQPREMLSNHPHPLRRLDPLAVTLSCHRGQEVCREGRPAEYWYCVISGAARQCVIRNDGRRQIVSLLLPGDFFGFSPGGQYDFSVEAIVEGMTVASYPRRRVEALADSDPELGREIREVAFETMSQLQTQLLILGRVTAPEKVGSFLLALAARLSNGQTETNGHTDNIVLPVSRYDIADFLAVSVETVSRSLTELKHRGVIALPGARIVTIVDRDALEDGERGYHNAHFVETRSRTLKPQCGQRARSANPRVENNSW